MASRWQFQGPSGWQEFHVEQHDGIHAAWLCGRRFYDFALAGHEYRIDLGRKPMQVNMATRTKRAVQPPAWASEELRVVAGRPARLQAEAASRLLEGSEDKQPVCELNLRGSGEAVPTVVEVAALCEAEGFGDIVKVGTELLGPDTSIKGQVGGEKDGAPKAEQSPRQSPAPGIEVRLRSREAVARVRRRGWNRLAGAIGAEAAQMPKLNLLRLMKEFRAVENALRLASAASGSAPSPSASSILAPAPSAPSAPSTSASLPSASCTSAPAPSPSPATTAPTAAAAASAPALAPALGGVVRVEPVEDSLLEWDVAMSFPEGSDLRRGLDSLSATAGDREDPDTSNLLLRARFPSDFPASPPEVWVRRPRLVHKTAPVSFGGRLCCHLLSSSGWEPATPMAAVFQEVQRSLLKPGTEVDLAVPVIRSYLHPRAPLLERLRTTEYETANSFARKGVKVLSPETAMPFLGNVERLERTDKIALPLEYLEEICRTRTLETPAMFEVKGPLGRKRHCAVFDWVDGIPSEHAILPRWVMDDLCIEEWEQVQVRGVKLDLVSYVKVQPHSAEFYEAAASSGANIKDLLTESLSRLSGLTEDACVLVHVGDRAFSMQVVELRPQGAVRIIDSDVEEHFEFKVDFEPAPDLQDEEALKARQEKLLADHRAQHEHREALRRAHEERRAAAVRRRYEAALSRAKNASGVEDDGREGPVEVPLQLPDGSQLSGRFREGAPIAALVALALSSPWAKAQTPLGVQLRERAPPRRALTETDGMVVDRAMHRSLVVVQQQVLEEGEDADELELDEASPGDDGAAPAPGAGGGNGGVEVIRPAPLAPPRPPLERSISKLQRRTLEAFEELAFLRAGVDPEEAERRARNGEVAPPASVARRQQQKNRPGLARREAPRRPELHRTVSQEERRELQVEEVMNIVGLTRGEAEAALSEHDWSVDRAINALFDDLGDDD